MGDERDRSEEEKQRAKDEVLNVRATAKKERGAMQRALVRTARILSHPLFFAAEAGFHVGWIAINSGAIPGVTPWDPYPYGLLGGIASIQALFIGLLILMYAEQEARTAEVREEMDLQVALHSERETSKVIRMITELHEALRVPSVEHDRELEVMREPIDADYLKETTERHLEEADES